MWVEVDQRSTEWLRMRCGCVTASMLHAVVAKLKRKTGEAAIRRNYKMAKVCEWVTGRMAEVYVTKEMDWGTENEPLAKEIYQMETDIEVQNGGLFVHDRIQYFMASPDSLCGDEGLAEFKCPTTENHLQFFLDGQIPEEYIWQILGQMACSGRQWVDYVSFDPRCKRELQFAAKRFYWDDAAIGKVEREVEQFLLEMSEMLLKLGQKSLEISSGDRTLVEPLKRSLEALNTFKSNANEISEIAAHPGIVP
jgi:putative phage-type endonuclease